jgi:hypothetical protein
MLKRTKLEGIKNKEKKPKTSKTAEAQVPANAPA